jgi:hypothetical protein
MQNSVQLFKAYHTLLGNKHLLICCHITVFSPDICLWHVSIIIMRRAATTYVWLPIGWPLTVLIYSFFVCVMQPSRFVLSIVDSCFSSCLMSVGIVPLFFLNMQKMNRVKGNCCVHPDTIYNYLHYSIVKTHCLLLHCDHLLPYILWYIVKLAWKAELYAMYSAVNLNVNWIPVHTDKNSPSAIPVPAKCVYISVSSPKCHVVC